MITPSEYDALKARIEELKAALREASQTWHSYHHPTKSGFWDECQEPACVRDRKLLEDE